MTILYAFVILKSSIPFLSQNGKVQYVQKGWRLVKTQYSVLYPNAISAIPIHLNIQYSICYEFYSYELDTNLAVRLMLNTIINLFYFLWLAEYRKGSFCCCNMFYISILNTIYQWQSIL